MLHERARRQQKSPDLGRQRRTSVSWNRQAGVLGPQRHHQVNVLDRFGPMKSGLQFIDFAFGSAYPLVFVLVCVGTRRQQARPCKSPMCPTQLQPHFCKNFSSPWSPPFLKDERLCCRNDLTGRSTTNASGEPHLYRNLSSVHALSIIFGSFIVLRSIHSLCSRYAAPGALS